jgi:predicted nucleic acid-binding protein
MSAIYLESSALLCWLLHEEGEERVRSVVDEAQSVCTSALTYAEVGRALVRQEHDGTLLAADRQGLCGVLAKVRRGWMTLGVTEEILNRLSRPFPVEPLRALDAIHLATALELAQALRDLKVLSLDRRILENARALGLV